MKKAVILAGGLGSRLKPFTEIIPKPLLPLGEKTILEIQINSLKQYDINEIFLAINYKADYIKAFFGNGSKYGVDLYYSLEEKPLGTFGPVTLLKDQLNAPFILMNGDILTKADLSALYNNAINHADALLTVGTKIVTTPFRFGRITCKNDYITQVEEKPNLTFEVLAGIYIVHPDLIQKVPDNTYYGIDTLIQMMIKKKMPINRYLIKEYWLDIGVVDDFEKARNVVMENFEEI